MSRTREMHGMTGTRLYVVWQDMKKRCMRKTDSHYKNYGARGIRVCDAWKDSFRAFYAWAMANGYSDTLTIDRIDVNGNYEPGNCRWADMETQLQNRRCVIRVEIGGEAHTLREWAEISGVNLRTIATRYKRGWRGTDLIASRLKKGPKLRKKP